MELRGLVTSSFIKYLRNPQTYVKVLDKLCKIISNCFIMHSNIFLMHNTRFIESIVRVLPVFFHQVYHKYQRILVQTSSGENTSARAIFMPSA